MSIREKYDELISIAQEEAEQERIRNITAEMREQNRRKELYNSIREREAAEKPEILRNLESKVIRLRRLGILSMIEEFTDTTIYPPYSKEIPHPKLSDIEKNLLVERTIRGLDRTLTREPNWAVIFIQPFLNDKLNWEDSDKVNLHIDRYYYGDTLSSWHEITKTEWVELTYNGSILSIRGSKEEFNGKIPNKRGKRVEVIENAFARAFFNPTVIIPKPGPQLNKHYSRFLDFNTPIGAAN